MKNYNVLRTTTNRSTFNKVYKSHLEQTGKIRCAWCNYHKCENSTDNWYGGFDSIDNVKRPNWKLVSKNKKQWMQKKYNLTKKVKDTNWGTKYIFFEITW